MYVTCQSYVCNLSWLTTHHTHLSVLIMSLRSPSLFFSVLVMTVEPLVMTVEPALRWSCSCLSVVCQWEKSSTHWVMQVSGMETEWWRLTKWNRKNWGSKEVEFNLRLTLEWAWQLYTKFSDDPFSSVRRARWLRRKRDIQQADRRTSRHRPTLNTNSGEQPRHLIPPDFARLINFDVTRLHIMWYALKTET